MITASCGHEVHSVDELYDLQLKGLSSNGEGTVIYGVYCKACEQYYASLGWIIRNAQEEIEWSGTKVQAQPDMRVLGSMANSLTIHDDPAVSSFAYAVLHYINAPTCRQLRVDVTISTGGTFSLIFNDTFIKEKQTISFDSIEDAMMALNGAYVHHLNDGVVIPAVDAAQAMVVSFCHEAALQLMDGETFINRLYYDAQLIVQVK